MVKSENNRQTFRYLREGISGQVIALRNEGYSQRQIAAKIGVGLGDILIYRNIFNRDYRIEGRNLSDDISKLSSWSKTIVILLRICMYIKS